MDGTEEALVWSGSRGQVANAGRYLMCLVGFWLLIPVAIAGWTWLANRMHRYELTTQRLRERSGVLNLRSDEVELYRVKDVTVNQPFVSRLVGRGNVVLQTSDRTTPRVELVGISRSREVGDLIRDQVELARALKGVREFD